MVKDRFDLVSLNSRKPTQKVFNRSAIPQVLKQGAYRHPRAPKYPGPTDFARYLFDSPTSAPIAHLTCRGTIMPFVLPFHLRTLPSLR